MDEAELRDDDLHDKRMARLKREREEKAADLAERRDPYSFIKKHGMPKEDYP